MDTIHVAISSPKVAGRLEARSTPALDAPGVVERDLARYYALVERLRGLSPVQLLAVIDLAERMDAATLRGDCTGREWVRREFGVGG
jgi:hypothetical protein